MASTANVRLSNPTGGYLPLRFLRAGFSRTAPQVTIDVGDPSYDPLFAYGHGLTYEDTRRTAID